jgi:hypothetical protein
MLHGIVLGGAALMGLFAALFAMRAPHADATAGDKQLRSVARLTVFVAAVLWVTVLTGTYVVFPPYRATPPEGVVDLARYPRALILDSPENAWLHTFAMESKEHMPWIGAMLATAVAFVGARCRSSLLADRDLRRIAVLLLTICFALASFTALMGIFVNKVAPLE